eukprot:3087209-Pleurochrysis_carterae.AAC.3
MQPESNCFRLCSSSVSVLSAPANLYNPCSCAGLAKQRLACHAVLAGGVPCGRAVSCKKHPASYIMAKRHWNNGR